MAWRLCYPPAGFNPEPLNPAPGEFAQQVYLLREALPEYRGSFPDTLTPIEGVWGDAFVPPEIEQFPWEVPPTILCVIARWEEDCGGFPNGPFFEWVKWAPNGAR